MLQFLYRYRVRHAPAFTLWPVWQELTETARETFGSLLCVEPQLREWSDDERAVMAEVMQEKRVRLLAPLRDENADDNPLV